MAIPRPAPGQTKWWAIGAVGITLGVLLTIWWGISASQGVQFNDAGHVVNSDSDITVMFDVTADRSKGVTCELQALAVDHSKVGSRTVTLPPSSHDSTRYTLHVRTTEHATTGTVISCDYTP